MAEENPPASGGCWICHEGNGFSDDSDMLFDMEFDTYYHPECLEEYNVKSVLAYEQQRSITHYR